MGYFVTVSGKEILEGNITVPEEEQQEERLAEAIESGGESAGEPFLLSQITWMPGSRMPYQVSHLTPRRYSYFALSQEDFDREVQGRGVLRHDVYRLLYVREGTLYHRVEAERHKLPAGSCLLLNRDVRCHEEYTTPFSTVCLCLSEKLFREVITDDQEKYFETRELWDQRTKLRPFVDDGRKGEQHERRNCIDFIPVTDGIAVSAREDRLLPLFDALARLVMVPEPGCTFLFLHLIARIFLTLSDEALFTTEPLDPGSTEDSEIFADLNAILEKHGRRITREQAAQRLGCSGKYLNAVVKRQTGMSYTEYASSVALKRVAWMLLHTEEKINDIAGEMGFINLTAFYKAFQKVYGEKPKEYRERNRRKF